MGVLKVGPKDTQAISAIAASIRRRSGQTQPHYSTQQMINACYPGTIVTGRKLPPNCHEFVMVDEGAFRSHRAPHVIVYQRNLSTDGQRYAIAHALGHIVFDGARHPGCGARDADCELRCDRFADELLVPIDELPDYVCAWPHFDPDKHETYLDQVDLIASHFRVPPHVIDKRIQELPRTI